MTPVKVKVSSRFRRSVALTLIGLILSLFIYISIVFLALIVTWEGPVFLYDKWIETASSIIATVTVGVLLMGIVVVIFLFKFLFSKDQDVVPCKLEINATDEPELFKLIEEINSATGTPRPNKVFLVPETTAAVTFSNRFLSLLFPGKKELYIGIGLLNTLTRQELKAVLAHEFGHFDQKSLMVGNYVMYANKVLYNLAYNNSAVDEMIEKYSGYHLILWFFLNLGRLFIEIIRSILKFTHWMLNIQYLRLSREMEFHADAVAAHVAGPSALESSLLRLTLGNISYNRTIEVIQLRLQDRIRPESHYTIYHHFLTELANDCKLELKNNLPEIRLKDIPRLNLSRVYIKDQWASHPELSERIRTVYALGLPVVPDGSDLAITLLSDTEKLYGKMMAELIKDDPELRDMPTETESSFWDWYLLKRAEDQYPTEFRGYFDQHIFTKPENFDQLSQNKLTSDSEVSMFSDEALHLIRYQQALQGDIFLLNQLKEGQLKGVRSFDFDGSRYRKKSAGKIIDILQRDLSEITARINQHDESFIKHCLSQAAQKGEFEKLYGLLKTYFSFDQWFDEAFQKLQQVSSGLQFTTEKLQLPVIRLRLEELKPLEDGLKVYMSEALSKIEFREVMTEEEKETLKSYTHTTLSYLQNSDYHEENLSKLFYVTNLFGALLSKAYQANRKTLMLSMKDHLKQ